MCFEAYKNLDVGAVSVFLCNSWHPLGNGSQVVSLMVSPSRAQTLPTTECNKSCLINYTICVVIVLDE